MKLIFSRIVFVIFIFFIIVMQGCNFARKDTELIKGSEIVITLEMQKLEDIPEWDIAMDHIDQVAIRRNIKDAISYQLTKREIEDLISAFNATKNSEIYWDLSNSENLYGYTYAFIDIKMKDGEELCLPYTPFGIISYKGMHYYTNYQLLYYDAVREIDAKYHIGILDLENEFLYEYSNNGFATACYANLICSPNKTINEARRAIGMSEVDNGKKELIEILDLYKNELMLNDVIETEDMRIKVIEIKDDHRVTAVAVEFKENGFTNE